MDVLEGDERYFEEEFERPPKVFDSMLLGETLKTLPSRRPLTFSEDHSVTEAVRAMQNQGRGCVLITEDGTPHSPLLGIFSGRDVLYRIVDRGRNPALLPLRDVMTPDPECLPSHAPVAWVLNKMAIGGFRHVPVIDELRHPQFVVSVRDVVDFLVEFFPREILNLPPEFDRRPSGRREGG